MPPRLDAWLRTHVVRTEPEYAARTSAALVTLGGRAAAMTGAERRATVRALLDVFRPRIIRGKSTVAPTDFRTLRTLRHCLMRLTMPWTRTGVPKTYVAELATDDPQACLRWVGAAQAA